MIEKKTNGGRESRKSTISVHSKSFICQHVLFFSALFVPRHGITDLGFKERMKYDLFEIDTRYNDHKRNGY